MNLIDELKNLEGDSRKLKGFIPQISDAISGREGEEVVKAINANSISINAVINLLEQGGRSVFHKTSNERVSGRNRSAKDSRDTDSPDQES